MTEAGVRRPADLKPQGSGISAQESCTSAFDIDDRLQMGHSMDLSCSEASVELAEDTLLEAASPSDFIRAVCISDSERRTSFEKRLLAKPSLQVGAYGQWSSDLEHLLHKETCTQQEGSHQPTTNAATRQLMVLWMRMVAQLHELKLSTLLLAVNLFDRFMANLAVQPCSASWPAELTATACVSVATKMDSAARRISPVWLQVGTPWEGHYTAAQIRDMELCLLAALGWRTAAVTAADCVDALLLETSALGGLQWQLKSTVRQQAYAVITHALAHFAVLAHRPSTVGCATVLIALSALGQQSAAWAASQEWLRRGLAEAGACASTFLALLPQPNSRAIEPLQEHQGSCQQAAGDEASSLSGAIACQPFASPVIVAETD